MIVKSVTMISWEFAPFYVRGGTAYAIRRLADQLTALGIETRVLLPDWPNVDLGPDLPALLKPIRMPMRTALRDAPPVLQYSEFCRAAVEAV
ncbi:MAG TPA: glycogen/starch synthase, partial [Pyrinomonadaceae bacterium]|nr:glycogen/starch synthase [Pyrinomonadaceae bacterium]